ncbi:MAG: hypothetical protein WC686_05835 [Candidatus Shapirobacteria bacterium]|jgi:amino acid transporter
MRKKYFLTIFVFLMIFFPLLAKAAILSSDVTGKMSDQSVKTQLAAGYEVTSIGSIIAMVIQAFLGLLGIIFIILLILAGYNWMTAAGDEQKVTKARDTIRTAVIGLIIIIAAYSITYFVFKALGKTTSGSNNTTVPTEIIP